MPVVNVGLVNIMNNAILIGLAVAAYLYFSNDTPATATGTMATLCPDQANPTPENCPGMSYSTIAIGEPNPSTPITDPLYLGGPGGGGADPVNWTEYGGPPKYTSPGADPFFNPFAGPFWQGPTYSEQYPVGPGVISAV